LTCANPSGSFTAFSANAVSYVWDDFIINPINTTSSLTINTASPKSRRVFARDINGCLSAPAYIDIVDDLSPPSLTVSANPTSLTCQNPTTIINA
jgi:hypothetical protein